MKKLYGLLFCLLVSSSAVKSMERVGKRANSDMAAVMNTTVNGAASILACSIIGKGIKNSFSSLKAIDEATSDKVINYGCASLYATFVISQAMSPDRGEDSRK